MNPIPVNRRRLWSPTRISGALALSAWAATFWFTLASGRSSLYLSPRVSWVIPVGAVLLTLVAAGQLSSARTAAPEALTSRSLVTLIVVLLPAVAILVLPPATLGSFAASRRSAVNAAVVREARLGPKVEIDLPLVVSAMRSPVTRDILAKLIERRGPRVTFEGFVTLDGAPQGGFVLSRFIIACCIADAVTAQIPVVGASAVGMTQDQWVRVAGDLEISGDQIALVATDIEKIPQPEQPYLWAR
jgi:uncharacterized repeat protein (TIGR03943 family)